MNGALRICLITGEYPPEEGGVADYTRCLAEALVERGLEVDVVTGPRHPDSDERGTAVEVVTGRRHPDGDNRVPVHRVVPGWGWSSLRRLRHIVATLEPDVVHVQYQTAAFDMHPAINIGLGRLGSKSGGRKSGALTAITYHDLREPYLFPKAGPVRGWVTRLPSRQADLTITTNEEDHSALAAWGHARRLALVPIGANVPDAPPAGWSREGWRDAAGIPRDADLLVYFGFLNPSKGGRTLLAALGRLVAQGRDARLVMLGGTVGASDATNAAELAAFANEVGAAGLSDRIIWTGYAPPAEVSGFLRAADVAVLPYADGASYRRGSLLAALEHGCAVVTTWPAEAAASADDENESAAESALNRHLGDHNPRRDGDSTSQRSGDRSARRAADSSLRRTGEYNLQRAGDSTLQRAGGSSQHQAPPPLRDGRSARLVRPGHPEALAAAVAGVLDDPALAARLSAGARDLAMHFGWGEIARRHEMLYEAILSTRREGL